MATTGKITTEFSGSGAQGQSTTVQADGKILLGGYALNYLGNYDFALARYNANGSLDTSFDFDGKLTTDIFGFDDHGRSVTVQADGKILLGGGASDNLGNYDFAMARYNANGSLDTSFDFDGKVTTEFFGAINQGQSITVQADGKILAGGFARNNFGKNDFALARYDTYGSLDTSFDFDGKLITTFFGLDDGGRSVTVQTDGKILLGGFALNNLGDYDFALARYNANGSLDISFGFDGKLTTNFFGLNDDVRTVAVQPDGKILLAGVAMNISGKYDFALARYDTSGSLDTSFDFDGKLTTDFFGLDEDVRSVAVQPDGKILLAGVAWNISGNQDFALARYNTNGSLDTSFDFDGKLTTDFGQSQERGESVTVQANGKILVGGSSNGAFVLVSYNSDGSLDASFGASDNDTLAPFVTNFGPNDEAVGVALNKNVVLTFSEAIQRGTGNIILRNVFGFTVAAYDAATSSNLSITGNTLTINPTSDLVYSTGYRVEFGAGTIVDLAGNTYAGTNSYNFTTQTAPETGMVLRGGSTNESPRVSWRLCS